MSSYRVVSSHDSVSFETGFKFGWFENYLRSSAGQGQVQSRWKTHSFRVSSMGNVRLLIFLCNSSLTKPEEPIPIQFHVIFKMHPMKKVMILQLCALSPQVRVRQVFRP